MKVNYNKLWKMLIDLNMSKTQLAREIGTSSQFLGFVEEGKGNLVYYSLRKHLLQLFHN